MIYWRLTVKLTRFHKDQLFVLFCFVLFGGREKCAFKLKKEGRGVRTLLIL